MNPTLARMAAIGMVALLAFGVLTLILTSRGGIGQDSISAEFKNAAPLLEGMDVRVAGGVAGSVNKIELTERGTALVTMGLNDGLDPARADASVAIRQQDLLGDSYVALALGSSPDKLAGTIPPERTIARPRTDDLFNVFQRPVRDGLRTILVELGVALERRGENLNETVLALRPGIEATDEILGELNSQTAALRAVITDARRFTTQAAANTEDFGGTVTALDETLSATAEHGPELDAALEQLPATLAAARTTLGKLETTASDARPLTETLAATAPDLRRSGELLPAFARDAEVATRDLGPTLDLLGEALDAGAPTLEELRDVDLKVLLPAIDLLSILRPIVDSISDGIFGADSYGADPVGEGGLGGAMVERGDQPSEPNTDPARRYLRTALVASCETLGLKIEPGCLGDLLSATAARRDQPADAAASDKQSNAAAGRPEEQPAAEPQDGRGSSIRDNLGKALDKLDGETNAGEDIVGLDRGLLDFLLGP